MTPDQYLQGILSREAVDVGPYSPVRQVQAALMPALRKWGGRYLSDVSPSGSFAKGTANSSGTDIDLFISLVVDTPDTLSQIYNSLHTAMKEAGLSTKKQNVSVNVEISGYSVDLVPGKRQNAFTSDHSLYRRKADSWTKTNVLLHVAEVSKAGRQQETRILKLWRNQLQLQLPSLYLELIVIKALDGYYQGTLSDRVWRVLTYLRDSFEGTRIIDPANASNVISDDLTVVEKAAVTTAATRATAAKTWGEIVK